MDKFLSNVDLEKNRRRRYTAVHIKEKALSRIKKVQEKIMEKNGGEYVNEATIVNSLINAFVDKDGNVKE